MTLKLNHDIWQKATREIQKTALLCLFSGTCVGILFGYRLGLDNKELELSKPHVLTQTIDTIPSKCKPK